jgi:hypothetical protein
MERLIDGEFMGKHLVDDLVPAVVGDWQNYEPRLAVTTLGVELHSPSTLISAEDLSLSDKLPAKCSL